jgi:hypothetical protein
MGHRKALIPHGKKLGKSTPFDRLLMDKIFIMPQWQNIHPNCGVGIFLVVIANVLKTTLLRKVN